MTKKRKLILNTTGRSFPLLHRDNRKPPKQIKGSSTASLTSEYYEGDHFKSLVSSGDLEVIREIHPPEKVVVNKPSAKSVVSSRRAKKTSYKKPSKAKPVLDGVDGE